MDSTSIQNYINLYISKTSRCHGWNNIKWKQRDADGKHLIQLTFPLLRIQTFLLSLKWSATWLPFHSWWSWVYRLPSWCLSSVTFNEARTTSPGPIFFGEKLNPPTKDGSIGFSWRNCDWGLLFFLAAFHPVKLGNWEKKPGVVKCCMAFGSNMVCVYMFPIKNL